MTETMTQVADASRMSITLDERLAAFPPEAVRPEKVRVVQVIGSETASLVGKTVWLDSIDRPDAWRTFAVREVTAEGGRGTLHWVHRVEPVTEEKEDAKDAEIARLRASLRQADARLMEFREQVRDVAIRVAEEQNWCDDGLNEVLSELGLEPKEDPEYEITVKVTQTYRITGKTGAGVDEGFVQSSIAIEGGEPGLDSDWDDVTVELVDDDFDVESVETL